MAGLSVAKRSVHQQNLVDAGNDASTDYAVLMPWIEGLTWYEFLVHKDNAELLSLIEPVIHNILDSFVDLEKHSLVHTDLAADNVVIDTKSGQISLIDLDFLHGPELPEPKYKPGGHPGYRHKTSLTEGNWHSYGDRFAGAVLLTEMLCWSEPSFRQVHDIKLESFFEQGELQGSNPKYELACKILDQRYGSSVRALFSQAWHSEHQRENVPPLLTGLQR